MTRPLRTLVLALLVALGVLALTTDSARAQFRGRVPMTVSQQSALNLNRAAVNPNFYIAPGLTLRQHAYNVSVLGRAYSHIPPYMLGYNPYPVVVNYGPVYPVVPGYYPYVYQPVVTPGVGNPYLGY